MFELNDPNLFLDDMSEELQPISHEEADPQALHEDFLESLDTPQDLDPLSGLDDIHSDSDTVAPKPLGGSNVGGWDCTSGCAGNCAGSCNWMCQNSAHNDPI